MVIYVEFFDDKIHAMQREKELKHAKGRAWVKNAVLPQYLIN